MKAIKFIVVVFLFISLTLARETVRPFTSQKTLHKSCAPACDLIDLDVGASEVKKSEVANNKEEQDKKQGTRQKVLKRRKVRRKFRKGLKGNSGQGLRRQEFGDEGGQKLQNQHDDAYQKQHEEGEAKKKYGSFNEAKAHKSNNQKQSYQKSYFRDLTKKNNKFYDIYDEGGYNNKGGHSYSSYNDIDYENKQKNRKNSAEEGEGHSSQSDYDKVKALSAKIAYDGKKGGDEFYSHEVKDGDETSKETEKKHESVEE